MRYCYAIVEPDTFGNFVCVGTIDTFADISKNNYIQTETRDDSLIGKLWTGSEWVENPNGETVEPIPGEPKLTDGDRITMLEAIIDVMLNGGAAE